METINKDLRAWNVEVVNPRERWGRCGDWILRLSHRLCFGFGRRWCATITDSRNPSRKFFRIGKNQGDAFAKAVADVEAGKTMEVRNTAP